MKRKVLVRPGRYRLVDAPASPPCPCRKHEGEPCDCPAAQIVVTADGLGDHLMGLAVAGAWRRGHPDIRLTLVAKPWVVDWCALFEGYDDLTTAAVEGVPMAWEARNSPHGLHFVEAARRASCGRLLPWPRPLPAEAVAWAEQFRGCIALAPFCLTGCRQWLESHWLELERRLSDDGRQVVVLDGRGPGRERTRHFRGTVVLDESPARVAALLAVADGFVGNDSGLAHLAGTLRVPGVVLWAHLAGSGIYDGYPTMRTIAGPLGCSGCHWRGPHYRPACDRLCASLQAIDPGEVMAALMTIARPAPGLLSDPAADRALAAEIAQIDGRPWHQGRRRIMGELLARLGALPSPCVVETGCMRADDDYGAGMSTLLLGRFLERTGRLTSVDVDLANVRFARSRTASLPVHVVHRDSVSYLRGWPGPAIAAVYLDSMDTYCTGFAEHCLAEAQAVMPHLVADGLVLIDDTWSDAGEWQGKGSLAVPWLLSQGFAVEAAGYQVLLRRPCRLPHQASEGAAAVGDAAVPADGSPGVGWGYLD